MKSIFTIASLTLAMLLGALFWGTTSAAAQEETSPREAILASIPTPSNFEEQADITFVGDVEGSYAFIAFVVRDGFAVVYLCDNVLNHWLSGEIVAGTLEVAAEDGTHVVATIFDDHVEGTVTLTTDDDGGEASPHAFTAVPAIPGETGLARHVESLDEELNIVSGWIVTEKGVRGRKSLTNIIPPPDECDYWSNQWEYANRELFLTMDDPIDFGFWMDMMTLINERLREHGCAHPVQL